MLIAGNHYLLTDAEGTDSEVFFNEKGEVLK